MVDKSELFDKDGSLLLVKINSEQIKFLMSVFQNVELQQKYHQMMLKDPAELQASN